MILFFRYIGLIIGVMTSILAYKFLPKQFQGSDVIFFTEIMKTYVTISTILIGFSTGITNNFITSTNSKMIKLIKKHNFYNSLLWQFHATTTINFLGMLGGMILMSFIQYIPEKTITRLTAIVTLTLATTGIAMYAFTSWTSVLIAKKTEECFDKDS